MFTHSRACVLALGSYAVATLVYAQPYPAKPIRIIVPGGPGGGIDTVTRLISPPLAAALGQPVIPDNRPGAGTVLASELTAKAAPDGYTFLAVTISHAINAGVQKNLRYDPINDFSEVTLTATVPNLLVVHPSVPAKSVKELIALAKRYPGQLFFASAGSGSGTHLAFELFQTMANISIVHVPYKSGTPALADVAGGHVQLMFSNTINSGPFVKARRLRALAITSVRRSALYPGLPTIAESGVPGYSSDAWYGVLAPARTPPDIIARLNREIVTLLKARELNEKLAAQGVDVVGSTQEEFAAWMRNEIRKWVKLTSALKLQTD